MPAARCSGSSAVTRWSRWLKPVGSAGSPSKLPIATASFKRDGPAASAIPPAARKIARSMPTRIDRRFRDLADQGRAGLVTFTMAGDPDGPASLDILKALPAAGADVIELGMPFTDPMADGPAVQAAGLRALKAGTTLADTLDMVRDFPPRGRRHADRADGLLQSHLHPRRRPLPRGGARGRRRRADRRRPAAGGRRRTLPAGARGGAQLHPARRRRRPTRRACPPCSRTRPASSTTSPSPASPARPCRTRRPSPPRWSASSARRACRSPSVSACATPRARRPSPSPPTRWSSARPSSRPCVARSTPTASATGDTVRGGDRLVRDLAAGVRARSRAVKEQAYELDLQRRPAEDPLLPASRDAGEPLGQVPRQRRTGLPQGPGAQPPRRAGLRVPHAHAGQAAPRQPVRREPHTRRSPRRTCRRIR